MRSVLAVADRGGDHAIEGDVQCTLGDKNQYRILDRQLRKRVVFSAFPACRLQRKDCSGVTRNLKQAWVTTGIHTHRYASTCGARACRDDKHGFQLYLSDPSGNFGGWKAAAIASNHQAASNILKTDYKDDCTLEVCRRLCLRTQPLDATITYVHTGGHSQA